MGICEFEENWAIASLVSKSETEEGRKELEQSRGLKAAVALENAKIDVSKPFDPDSASPEELDTWIRSMQGV